MLETLSIAKRALAINILGLAGHCLVCSPLVSSPRTAERSGSTRKQDGLRSRASTDRHVAPGTAEGGRGNNQKGKDGEIRDGRGLERSPPDISRHLVKSRGMGLLDKVVEKASNLDTASGGEQANLSVDLYPLIFHKRDDVQ